MGHLKRIAQGIRSTKTTELDPIKISPADWRKQPLDQKYSVGVQCVSFQQLRGTILTDQIGRFPLTSAQGNTYVIILYDFDSNAILATAIKSKKKEDLITRFSYLHKQLTDARIYPVFHKLNKEVSADSIEEIET